MTKNNYQQIESEKKRLRQQFIHLRNCQKDKDLRIKSEIIKDKLFSMLEFKEAKVIMFYLSIKSEVRTDEMIEEAIKLKKRIVLPKTDITYHQLIPREIRNLKQDIEEVQYPKFVLREPKGEREIKLSELDLVVVPGVAFDKSGYRLGYGGGFYDRFLKIVSPSTPCWGIGFELQVTEKLPIEPNDFPLDGIITEERIIKIDKKVN